MTGLSSRRAPLRHIVGYAEMLREDGEESLTTHGRRCVDTIIESSEYAGRLVDKLLDYSRLGRSALQRSRVDMNQLFREMQTDVSRDAQSRVITWHIAELPTVSADLMMLRMVVRDLLSNAVKYTRNREQRSRTCTDCRGQVLGSDRESTCPETVAGERGTFSNFGDDDILGHLEDRRGGRYR